jgi:small-conductance mechanosensitive channel
MAVTWEQVLDALRRYFLASIGVTAGDVDWFLIRVPRFLLVTLAFILLGKGLVRVLGRTLLAGEPEDPMIRSLVESLVFAVSIILGIGAGLRVYGIHLLDLAVTLGLIGAGLALGLRNSVANIMGGIALATDQPFEVGDRIQIGDFWGDVVEIGLRSTRVLTARREYVTVPNSLMDEREIWNYTKDYEEFRLEVGVTVSYDSDVERAKAIMARVARDHDEVLDFPEPRVLARGFRESGVELELWCHIGNARRRYHVGSDLREDIHGALRGHGVEIPYPYRTLVEKGDLPEPQEGVPEGVTRDDLGPRRILVATSGATPTQRKARTIADLAGDLEADIVLAYITSRPSILTEREGEMAAEVLEDAAADHGVDVKLVMEEGDVVQAVKELVDERNCGAAVIGASRQPALVSWRRAQVEDRLRRFLDKPVIVMSDGLEVDDAEVEAVRESLDAIAAPDGE